MCLLMCARQICMLATAMVSELSSLAMPMGVVLLTCTLHLAVASDKEPVLYHIIHVNCP